MFYTMEEEKRIYTEQSITRPAEGAKVNLCQYKTFSCVRCCLPHIGEDSPVEVPKEEKSSYRYLGPHGIVMEFTNFNPLKDPRIEASTYEDSFPDVGREEMERRFSERRRLFLAVYNREQPRQSLTLYMKAAQKNEGYRYQFEASAGPASQYLGGPALSKHLPQGELPECQLLGFVDGKKRVGCMAHPFAEISQGYDGRDQVGFFHHTGCCDSVGCEASKEFRYLSPSALEVFDKAVDGMSWYAYSRHATSVLVYYLRSYEGLIQRLAQRELWRSMTLRQLVRFTNSIYSEWPLRTPDSHGSPDRMNSLDILSTNIPLEERILYIALNTSFRPSNFAGQLQNARAYLQKQIEAFAQAPGQYPCPAS